jgi:hypothetical protein
MKAVFFVLAQLVAYCLIMSFVLAGNDWGPARFSRGQILLGCAVTMAFIKTWIWFAVLEINNISKMIIGNQLRAARPLTRSESDDPMHDWIEKRFFSKDRADPDP